MTTQETTITEVACFYICTNCGEDFEIQDEVDNCTICNSKEIQGGRMRL